MSAAKNGISTSCAVWLEFIRGGKGPSNESVVGSLWGSWCSGIADPTTWPRNAIADIRHPDKTLKRCFPHMFRDTFAVEMLLAGVPLDQVSVLLGHSSVKTTEKHYAPFVKARQGQIIAKVERAWKVMKRAEATRSKRKN